MKMRIRNKWRNKAQPGSVEENAAAIAYAGWQIALAAAKNLHAEDFAYDSDEQRVKVIAEYLIFQFHIADRFSFNRLESQTRHQFVTELARQMARHYQRNVEDISGAGDYSDDFVNRLNHGVADYSTTTFDGEEPGYGTRRILGERIQTVMGVSQTNKWVIQQIIDIDAVNVSNHLHKTMISVFDSSKAGSETGR